MRFKRLAAVFNRLMGYDRNVYNTLRPHLDGKILSVGCGEGRVERMLQEQGVEVTGVEVTMYKEQQIPVRLYDGKRLPFKDKSFDTVIFVYVLHHTNDIESLLKEAARVSSNVLILDHTYSNPVARAALMLYDYLVNIPYNMPIPLNFLRVREWLSLFKKHDLRVVETSVPCPVNVFFRLRCIR